MKFLQFKMRIRRSRRGGRRPTLQPLNNLLQSARLSCVLVTQLIHLLLQLLLNLLHAILHVQNRFHSSKIDAKITHQAANMDDALDITVRVQSRTMRAITLARRRDQPQAFVMTQRLFMYISLLRGYADDVPCAITVLRHDYISPFASLCRYFDAPTTCKLLKQLALLCREVHREDNFDTCIHIAVALATQAGHPFSSQAEYTIVLRLRWNGQEQLTPIGCWHSHLTAEHRFDQFD